MNNNERGKNAKMNTGSICLTDLIESAKNLHSAFTKGNNGKIYANIIIWENPTPDDYGNTISLQLNSKKDMKEQDGKTVYFGNAKSVERKAPEPLQQNDLLGIDPIDDLPF